MGVIDAQYTLTSACQLHEQRNKPKLMVNNTTSRYFLSILFIGFFFSASAQDHIDGDHDFYKIYEEETTARYFFPENTQKCFSIEICGLKQGVTTDFFSGYMYYPGSARLSILSGAEEINVEDRLRVIPISNCVVLNFCSPEEDPIRYPFLSWSKYKEDSDAATYQSSSYRGGSDNRPIGLDASVSAEDLIKEILIGGNCFDVHNVIPIGPNAGRGMFFDGTSSIGIDRGVVLSTGNLRNIEGPNESSARGNNLGGVGDDDLHQLIGGGSINVFDAVGIQFDFVPTSEEVRFRYVFASEEYCEFVGAVYNDVFGFFISGPGINGPFSNDAENIALVPGTDDFVSINNVNRENNQDFYFDNTPDGQPQSAGQADVCGPLLNQDGIAVELIEFDGFTAVFEATARVIPCSTYTIKMVVGDVFDSSYDSAVFLEAGSFDAGASAKLDADVEGVSGNIVYDHCLQGQFIVSRIGSSDLSEPVVVRLNFSPESTAIPGVDFEPLPDSVVIPANEEFVIIPITILSDTYSGGELQVIYELDFLCSCNNPFAKIILTDESLIDKIDAYATDILSCVNDEVQLFGDILESSLITSFEWRDSEGNILDDGSSEQISVSEPGLYLFIGYNEMSGCVDTAFVTVELDRTSPEIALEEPEILDCDRTSVALSASGSSFGDSISYVWTTTEGELIDGSSEIVATAARPGWYYLEVINNYNGCRILDSIQVFQDDEVPIIEVEPYGDLNCRDHRIDLNAANSHPIGDLMFSWEVVDGAIEGSNDQPVLSVLEPGVYQLEITLVRNGCVRMETFVVEQDITVPQVDAGVDLILPCTDPEVTLTGTGNYTGSEPEIVWTTLSGGNISGSATEFSTTANQTGTYILSVTNTINYCASSDTMVVYQNLPVDIEMEVIQPVCPGDRGFVRVISVEGGVFPFQYQLMETDEVNDHGWFEDLSYRTFELLLTDDLGCEYSTAFEIIEPRKIEVRLDDSDIADLGRPYQIKPQLSFPESELALISWTPSDVLDCPDCLMPNAFILEPTEFEIYLEDIYGCPARASIMLWMIENTQIFVPNAFSPNQDGINDFLDVYADQSVELIKDLVIYNRWGVKVFERTDFEPNEQHYGWDGTINGELAPPGVYFFSLEYVLINGHEGKKMGEFTLFR